MSQKSPTEPSLTETATNLDGSPDMRRKENRDNPEKVAEARGEKSIQENQDEEVIGKISDRDKNQGKGASSPDHTTKEGNPDHRFKENR